MDFAPLDCAVAGRCSGCAWLSVPYAEQLERKRARVVTLWTEAGLPPEAVRDFCLRGVAAGGLRERVELIFRNDREPRLGLYDVAREEIVPFDRCPQMTPGLEAWFREFREMPPPVRVGTVRLRVSPTGAKGAWLDFANTDVKRLLEERAWLEGLLQKAVVEIGQRRKRLERKGEGLGLGKPRLEPWFSTFLEGKPQPLYTAIGGFTQVGLEANRELVATFAELLPRPVQGRWLELGAGSGNFTLPLAHLGVEVDAIETEPLALEGLTRAVTETGLFERVRAHALGFHADSPRLRELVKGAEGIVADPPRSGLQRFPTVLESLAMDERPRHFVYVSCAAESFCADAVALSKLGYRLVALSGVDQFPQTPHVELVARFARG